ncbi:sterol desaturase [Gammaproteobacteria bacterium 45_16_T64]|nr:sterol desaturase [Gammaproteobacteria bacterium 45_16_T64]
MNDVIHAIGFILTFGVLFMAIIVAEYVYWQRKGKSDVYNIKETAANITTGFLYKMFDGIAVALFIQFFYDYVRELGFQYTPSNLVLGIFLMFIAADFFFYWFHFSMHKVRWFWAVHVTHHSSTRMNFSTALRQNFLLDLNFGWVLWWVPLAIIGFDKTWTIIAIEINLAYQFFLHTELTNRIKGFDFFFNTPMHHRIHHGSNPDQIDTNFGGTLIIWDRIFGTFQSQDRAGTVAYGLTARQPTTLNPLRLNLDELFSMIGDVWRYKDLRILIKPPGWVDEQYPETAALDATEPKTA